LCFTHRSFTDFRIDGLQNPPLPPGVVDSRVMHTLRTSINGDLSSGTGPSHEIAKANRYFPLGFLTPGIKDKSCGYEWKEEKRLQFGFGSVHSGMLLFS
jgi:hypothetical protein